MYSVFFICFVGGENSSDSDVNIQHDEMIYEEVDARNEIIYDDFDSSNSDVSEETYIKPLHQVRFHSWSLINISPCGN